jgi:hypothetical protein
MPAAAKQSDASHVAELLTVARRPPAFRIDDGAPRAVTGEGCFVTRGVHVKTGAPHLIHVDGSTMTGTPLGYVGAAILGQVITDAEIEQLRAARS